MSKIFRIAIGIILIVFLLTGSALGTAPWWDTSRHFRVSVTVGATGFERYEKPAELNVDFTQLFNEVGQTGTLDENSIRVIEVDSVGTILNTAVPFQFDKDSDYNPTTKASGNIVLIMNGTTPTNTNRYYYIYFDMTGSSFSPPSVATQVTITDNIMDEGQNSYRINATDSTYYFQKDAGGFSSWNDKSGNDWISYSTATGTSGVYRGIPNAVYALGIFHPGFTCCTSNIVSQGPIKIRIRSISNDGQWESIWDMYPRYATMTMTKANSSYGYWMLYEGTPGGTLEPNTDFMFKSNGVKTYLNQSWYNDIASNEWLYFSDPNVGGIGRSLFVTHREDDTLQDMYKPLSYPAGQGLITVFGFGRSESPVRGLLNYVPQHFTIGLMDGTGFIQNSKIVQSAYKDLTITKGFAEQYGNTNINEIQLTSNNSFDRQPSWSPDGQWVSFVSDRTGNWEIYKVSRNGEGTGLVKLTNYGGFDLEPSWNPNARIVFAAGSGQGYEDVYVMNADGTGRQQLTFETDFDEYPDWSPDGSKIAYSSVGGIVGGAKQIWVMNANGTGKYRLNTVWGIQAAWSPDGTKIAFKCYNSGTNICVMNSNGAGTITRLTSETANTHDPDWSPDGTKIAYASQSDGDWEIYTINANGTGRKQLTSNVGIEDNFPVWSPDGQYIAYSSNRSGNEEIWLMRLNSGGTTTLSITSSSPTTNPTTIIGATQTFSINLNKNANIVWNVDGTIVKTDLGMSTSSYTNSTAGIGTHIVNVTATNGTEVRSREWIWTVQNNVPSITVISPNGGENWINNTVRTINWNYNSNPGSLVQIELLKGGILDSIISPSTSIGSSGIGSYNWLIPSAQTLGNDYKVRITSTSDSSYNDTSNNNFTISSGAITTTVNFGIAIKQGYGSVEVFKNDSGIWTSLGSTTTNKTYTVIKSTQLKIQATSSTGYAFEKYVSNNGITIITNPLIAYQNYNGAADTYFKATVNLIITIKQGSGSVEVFKNDSGIWTSLGSTTTSKTYTVIKGTQLKIQATPSTGYIFEKYVSNNGIIITTNPLVAYQNYNGGADTYFNVTIG